MSPFEVPFMRTALAAGLLAGTALALMGVFLTVRRVAFAGLAVSQLAGLGTAAATLLQAGMHGAAHRLAFLLVVGGMLALARLSRARSLPQESWVGWLYVLGAALAVLVLSKAPGGESETFGIFFGNILALGRTEVWESFALFLAVAGTLSVWFHRWTWIFFDTTAAEVAGVRVGRWNLLFYALFALAMTLSIHIFGVLLAFAYLALPAAAGLLTARRTWTLFVIVPAVTCACTVAGLYLSFLWDFPSGPFTAALLAGAVLAAKGLAVLRAAEGS